MTDLVVPAVGDPAPAGIGLDDRGEPVPFEQYWRGGRMVLVFLRHWG